MESFRLQVTSNDNVTGKVFAAVQCLLFSLVIMCAGLQLLAAIV